MDNENAEEITIRVWRQWLANNGTALSPLLRKKEEKGKLIHHIRAQHRFQTLFSLHDESSNDEDVLENEFQEILKTPEVKKKSVKQLAKSHNLRAFQITKLLFTDKQDTKPVKDEKKQTKQKRGWTKTSEDSKVEKTFGRGKIEPPFKDLLWNGTKWLPDKTKKAGSLIYVVGAHSWHETLCKVFKIRASRMWRTYTWKLDF